MHLFLALIGRFIPAASAQTLKNAGQGGAGVSDMWDQICDVIPCITSYGDGGTSLIDMLSSAVIRFIFPLTSVVAVIMVIYAGITIIISDGSDDKIGEAKKIITYAAGGVILSLLTTGIISFVKFYLSNVLR